MSFFTTFRSCIDPRQYHVNYPLSEIDFLSARQHRIANVWCGSVASVWP